MNIIVTLMFLSSHALISATILPLRRREAPNRTKPIMLTENGAIYQAQVQVGDQTFYLIPDTGSSDLWVPVSDFQCVDPMSGDEVSQEACTFGGTYQVPASTEYVTNQTFGVQYGTGIATGKVAYVDVTLNGITVRRQEIGLVDRTNDVGDGIGSGVLGLGFPPLTSAHPGTQVDNTTLLMDRVVYNPLFVNMYEQGLVEAWYSFAVDRPPKNATSGPGGYLALGELPPVSHSDRWAVKPIEVTEGLPEVLTGGRDEISLMTLTVDGITWGPAASGAQMTTNSTRFQAVVDTGNHMNLFPKAVADSISSAFDPPGEWDEDLQVYIVDCNATTPSLGVTLDGQVFWHQEPDDLMFHDISGFCYSSVGPTGVGSGLSLNFIGDAFLRNVVSVYDLGKKEMRFATRTRDVDSSSDSDPLPTAMASVRLPSWSLLLLACVGAAYF